MINAFGNAARRVKDAGFDGVQIHSAHGYLISQFLSPYANQRTDEWGGDFENRTRFLREVSREVREQVGEDYPVLIKLGIMDGVEGGLELSDGVEIVSILEEIGIDGVEISGGFSGGEIKNTRKGIKSIEDEGYFLEQAREACQFTNLPLISVGGYRTKSYIEHVLENDYVEFVSMCRPLISEPDLPNMFRDGVKDKSRCLSSNNCWAENPGEGIACKCPHDKVTQDE
jgi:2,4-dienoyl-CoA reductase-like NADH-dependent reductase (Old Yellow Enzyme family)